MNCPFGRTVDGFETHFGTNHLGHFLLVNRIAPLIRDGGRVVVLTSMAHHTSDVDLDDPGFERTAYVPFQAYGRSKTANVLFAIELDRRLRRRGIRGIAVQPGGVRTPLLRHTTPEVMQEMMQQVAAHSQRRADGSHDDPVPVKTVEQGAATTVWAAFVAPADAVGGRYCEDCHVAEVDRSGAPPGSGPTPSIPSGRGPCGRRARNSSASGSRSLRGAATMTERPSRPGSRSTASASTAR